MSGWLQGMAACSAWPLVGPCGTAGLRRHAWGRPVRAAKQATRGHVHGCSQRRRMFTWVPAPAQGAGKWEWEGLLA